MSNPAAEWIARWPQHCKSCMGAGQHHLIEQHDPDMPGEPMTEECLECIGKNQCPRCGRADAFAENVEFERLICCYCAWIAADPDICPMEDKR